MAINTPLLIQIANQLEPYLQAKRWVIGFSGGMDSTVLLHLVTQLAQKKHTPPLSAIYIHHGLQKVADTWPSKCQAICNALNVPLQIIKVNVAKQASIEQAARNARYTAFTSMLQEGDVLLTAQHQNDQAETLLFRLMRGTGLRGLIGIPRQRSLASALVVRPLLNTPHKHLQTYAKQHSLQWIKDPSNQDTLYARNYLRHVIIPKLQDYWPQAVSNIAQAANHLQEAQLLLNELAQQDLKNAQLAHDLPWLSAPCLDLKSITQLSLERQKNALSFWLNMHKILMPTTEHWQGWLNLISAKPSAKPCWKLQDAEIQRDTNTIWLLSGTWLDHIKSIKHPISTEQCLTLPDNGFVTIIGKRPNEPLFISYRQGGEIMALANRGHRDLKRLLNEFNIPRFIRSRLPLLINQQGQVIAVANFPEWKDKNYPQHFTFEWRPEPLQY